MMTERRAGARWKRRPGVQRVLGAFISIGPLAAAALVATGIAFALAHDGESTGLIVAVAFAASTMLYVVAALIAELLIPLRALYGVELNFPGRAPSRRSLLLRARALDVDLADIEQLKVADLEDAAVTSICLAATLDLHDRATRGHSDRVQSYADLIATELGMSAADRRRLRWAAMLHDIGKLHVPSEILNKSGRPTDDEWIALRSHSAVGWEMIQPLHEWLGDFSRAVLEHHERIDGTGYPSGLSGVDISLAARIVSVADAFDVMTSKRSYKEPMPRAEAIAELRRCAGTQFDVDVVEAFIAADPVVHERNEPFWAPIGLLPGVGALRDWASGNGTPVTAPLGTGIGAVAASAVAVAILAPGATVAATDDLAVPVLAPLPAAAAPASAEASANTARWPMGPDAAVRAPAVAPPAPAAPPVQSAPAADPEPVAADAGAPAPTVPVPAPTPPPSPTPIAATGPAASPVPVPLDPPVGDVDDDDAGSPPVLGQLAEDGIASLVPVGSAGNDDGPEPVDADDDGDRDDVDDDRESGDDGAFGDDGDDAAAPAAVPAVVEAVAEPLVDALA